MISHKGFKDRHSSWSFFVLIVIRVQLKFNEYTKCNLSNQVIWVYIKRTNTVNWVHTLICRNTICAKKNAEDGKAQGELENVCHIMEGWERSFISVNLLTAQTSKHSHTVRSCLNVCSLRTLYEQKAIVPCPLRWSTKWSCWPFTLISSIQPWKPS